MSNQADFDMIITGYAGLMDMVEKDYLLTLDQIGMETYPAKLLDVSELLTYNGKLFALPISIRQEAWFFHYELSEQNNICLLYTSPSPRDKRQSRMPSSA